MANTTWMRHQKQISGENVVKFPIPVYAAPKSAREPLAAQDLGMPTKYRKVRQQALIETIKGDPDSAFILARIIGYAADILQMTTNSTRRYWWEFAEDAQTALDQTTFETVRVIGEEKAARKQRAQRG